MPNMRNLASDTLIDGTILTIMVPWEPRSQLVEDPHVRQSWAEVELIVTSPDGQVTTRTTYGRRTMQPIDAPSLAEATGQASGEPVDPIQPKDAGGNPSSYDPIPTEQDPRDFEDPEADLSALLARAASLGRSVTIAPDGSASIDPT